MAFGEHEWFEKHRVAYSPVPATLPLLSKYPMWFVATVWNSVSTNRMSTVYFFATASASFWSSSSQFWGVSLRPALAYHAIFSGFSSRFLTIRHANLAPFFGLPGVQTTGLSMISTSPRRTSEIATRPRSPSWEHRTSHGYGVVIVIGSARRRRAASSGFFIKHVSVEIHFYYPLTRQREC
jgi:hypothetical protein